MSNVALSGSEILPYGIQMVQADKIITSTAGNRKVCIIDSGYSDQHDDLRDYTGADLTAKLSDAGSGTWNRDSCGMAAMSPAPSPRSQATAKASSAPIQAWRSTSSKCSATTSLVEGGSCGWTYSSTLVSALNSCRDAGANVVSMSLGGGLKSRTEENAFNSANKAGVLSIAAAGNAGNNTTSYPAGYAAVMSVAAVDANGVKGTFSQSNKDVEIAAPGVAVLSTTPWLDSNTLTAGATAWVGGRLDGAPRTTTGGELVYGGQCTAAGAWSGKVVLCQRGTNSFADKVAKVQSGGGAAAVVYNNVANDPTCGVFSGTLGSLPTTTIAAVTLSCADGSAAVAAAGSAGTVASEFSVPESGYEAWDGTSMATPHVSAVAALIWSCNTTKTNQQIRSALDRDRTRQGRGRP